MNEQQAKVIAEAIGGEPWQSGGDVWVVMIRRADGRIVMISDECIAEYEGEDPADDLKQTNVIHFAARARTVEFDDHGRMYILGLPVEPDMPMIRDLLGDDDVRSEQRL